MRRSPIVASGVECSSNSGQRRENVRQGGAGTWRACRRVRSCCEDPSFLENITLTQARLIAATLMLEPRSSLIVQRFHSCWGSAATRYPINQFKAREQLLHRHLLRHQSLIQANSRRTVPDWRGCFPNPTARGHPAIFLPPRKLVCPMRATTSWDRRRTRGRSSWLRQTL